MDKDSGDERRKERERVMVQEGIQIWKQKKQDQWQEKLREQRELREMMSKYSPWGRPGGGAPNPDGVRKRKVHLQGLFAEEDKKNLGVVLNRNGSSNSGINRSSTGQPRQQSTAYKHDPLLRFQFNEPVRRCVDNVLRYRKSPQDKQAYKQQLDAMVAEKRRLQAEEMKRQAEAEAKLGWSDEITLRCLQDYEEQLGYYNKLHFPEDLNKGLGGVELVPLLARRRTGGPESRHPLSTTDVTRVRPVKPAEIHKHNSNPQDYTRELGQQVVLKQQRRQQERMEEAESSRRHFETWQQFWGRPGHGAPKEVKVKGNIDVLLHRLPVM